MRLPSDSTVATAILAADSGRCQGSKKLKQAYGSAPFVLVRCTVLVVCLAVLLRTFFLDSYHVPTGSMAPALVGDHRACVCPRCGYPVQVGLHEHDDGGDETRQRWYQRAWCPNCGETGLP